MEVVRVVATERPLAEAGIDISGSRSRVRLTPPRPPRQTTLRHRKQRPPAARADPLVVLRVARDLVVEAEARSTSIRVLDVHREVKRLAAAAAVRQFLVAATSL